jgi:uncharacterized protein
MEFPQEIEVWYTIPAVRRELARRLVASGLTQRVVAQKLGVTEAAVSQYLSNKRGVSIEYPAAVQKSLAAAAKTIHEADDTSVVRREIQNLCNIMKEHKVICDIHKKHGPVKDGCSNCFD